MTADGRILRWVPWSVVVLTGLLLGAFVWNTFLGPAPHLYPNEFDRGRWMTTAERSPHGYFLKELFVPGVATHAWIRVTATDSFRITVNGRTVGSEGQPTVNVSGAFPIGHVLRSGRNVIGLRVRRTTHGPARAAVEGGYLDLEGHEHAFYSDGSWRASSHEDNRGRDLPWYAPAFPLQDWPAAKLESVPSTREVARMAVHPAVAAMPFRGQWLGYSDPRTRAVLFERTFNVDGPIQGAWIRIAADERYDLAVNGAPIASRDTFDQLLDLHEIGSWLVRGENTLQVLVAGQRASAPRLALDGFVASGGALHSLPTTDAAWRAREPKSGQWRTATVMAAYSPIHDRIAMEGTTSAPDGGRPGALRAPAVVCIVLMLLLVLSSWVAFSWHMHRKVPGLAPQDAWLKDAILHLPVLLVLGGLYLLQYDMRLDQAFPFQTGFVFAAVAMLCMLRAGWLLESRVGSAPAGQGRSVGRGRPPWVRFLSSSRRLLVGLAIAAVAIAGLWLRADHAQATSLMHDEVGMAQAASGIYEHGYPVKERRDGGKTLTTYELVPYPIAASMALFGRNEIGVRIPALVFATLTLLLIAHVGSRVWSVGVGLLGAAVYAFLPFAVVWGSNATHPQQTQFFTLLTSYLFYRGLLEGPIRPRYVYGAAGSFVAAYLSWEGTGLLLGALFVGLLVGRGKDLTWVKSRPLWLASASVGLVVLFQLSRRILENAPYLAVGNGKALSGTTLSLVFLHPLYDPLFYVWNLLFVGNHAALTFAVLLGLPFLLRHPGGKYYLSLLVVLLALMTNFLPARSVRYAYYLDPFLILAATAATIYGCTAVWKFLQERRSVALVTAKALTALAFVAGLILLSNNHVLRLDRLESVAQHPLMSPEVHSFPDYRSTDRFLKRRLAPGDAVLCLMPHTFEFYAGRTADYYLQTETGKQVFYSNEPGAERYLDKYVGTPVLRDRRELEEALHQYRRAWIVAAPAHAFKPSFEPGIVDYIEDNARVVFESYKSKVLLWER